MDEPSATLDARLRDRWAVGSLSLDRRLLMAPMAGISTQAFRRSVRRWGAGLVFTEMISSHGVAYRNRRTTVEYLACGQDEHPIGYQLFGADPEILAQAVPACLAAGADLIDLNLACPVRKVTRTGAGAALLAQPERAADCVRAIVDAVAGTVPVTAKIRAGLRVGDEAGRRAAPGLVAAGAAAVCIHPRAASELYRGRADHSITLALADDLDVPVIASGDIGDREVCAGLLDGGVAAVMVARAALGRPWIFSELLEGAGAPPLAARQTELKRFVGDVAASLGARAPGHLRQFWSRFRKSGTIDAATCRRLMEAPDVAALAAILGMTGAGWHTP